MARSFYCNHCGKKVSRSSESCPSCGRLFGAVLCPRCGFSGDPDLFFQGCPACGFLEEKERAEYTGNNRNKGYCRRWPQLSGLFYLIGIGVLFSLILFLLSLL